MKSTLSVLVAASAVAGVEAYPTATATNPTVKLNNGVELPLVALGVWQYDNATAQDAITKALGVGYVHFDTAYNYNNQQGVGKALKGVDRKSFFLTTKTPPCSRGSTADDCYKQTVEQLEYDLTALQMDYVDLVLIHGSSGDMQSTCDAAAHDLDYAQWKAYEEFYAKGKARAIGLSNYCVSCLEGLYAKPLKVKPTVNQIQLHVGMGQDDNTQTLLKKCDADEIVPQAYSPLGNGKLIGDKELEKIGANYNKTSAQVALKWIVSQGYPLATKADSVEYQTQDLDLFSWNFTAADMATLSGMTSPTGRPSWSCTA